MKKIIFLGIISVFLLTGGSSKAEAKHRSENDARRVRFTIQYDIIRTGGYPGMKFTALIPRDLEEKQKVLGIDYSQAPARIYDANGTRYAEFHMADSPGRTKLEIGVDIELYRYDLSRAEEKAEAPGSAELARYLKSEQYVETGAPAIIAAAKTIDGRDEREKIRQIFDYVLGSLEYRGYVSENVGAAECLRRSYGDCSDYSDVIVALSRAVNIPARTVDGYLVDFGRDTPRHTWVELYAAGHGWIPFDPLLIDLRKVTFEKMKTNYIYLSTLRNDPALGNYHFYVSRVNGGRVKVNESYRVEEIEEVASKNE